MESLPQDIENIILDYKYSIEFDEKNKKVLEELKNYNDAIQQIIQIIPYFPSEDC